MFDAFYAAVAGHRRPVLAVATLVTATVTWSYWWGDDDIALVHAVRATRGWPLFAVTVPAFALTALAWARRRPARLRIDPARRAFRMPPRAADTFGAVWMLTMVANLPSGPPPAGWLRAANLAVGLVLALLVLAGVFGAWRGVDLALTPDGLHQRHPLGSFTVPWAALAPGYPQRPSVADRVLVLTYARPDLVRRRGLVRGKGVFVGTGAVRVDGVHPWLIADVIRYYVEHPGRRAAIGTEAEYQRLHHALSSAPRAATG